MNYSEYEAWKKKAEGIGREITFGKVEGCELDDSMILIECDEELKKLCSSESHRNQYVREILEESEIQVLSYHAMTFEGEDVHGEEILKDESIDVESIVERNIENCSSISTGQRALIVKSLHKNCFPRATKN